MTNFQRCLQRSGIQLGSSIQKYACMHPNSHYFLGDINASFVQVLLKMLLEVCTLLGCLGTKVSQQMFLKLNGTVQYFLKHENNMFFDYLNSSIMLATTYRYKYHRSKSSFKDNTMPARFFLLHYISLFHDNSSSQK